MKSVGIREAKAHLSALARAAAAGEPTLLTDYGKALAVITALTPEPARDEVSAAPIEAPLPPTAPAAFRRALLSAPHELALDF